MRSFYIESYGCQMNVADSESLAGILLAAGFAQAEKPARADLILVNTCTVRESAVSRVLAQISRFKPLKAKNKGLKIAVTGCLAQQEKKALLKKLPFIDYVVGPDQYRFLAELTLDKAVVTSQKGPGARDFYTDFEPVRKNRVNAWIPIMRGCDNFCSYCIVPYVRGREASKPLEKVLDEIRRAVDQGFMEVTLLGQNVNSYRSGNTDFPALLRKIDTVSGLRRVRFMTSHPKDISADLIQCFGGLSTLCEHLHLPVQSGSNRVLERMNRGYTRESFLDQVRQLRARVPDMALTTDILCGFPGETDQDHRATVDLVREAEFDAAFMFVYSPRKGTKAARFRETLDRARKVERVNEIIRLQMDITRQKNAAQTGTVHEVLAEGISPRDPDYITARTRTFKNVILKGDQKSVNRLFTVKITGSTGWALRGEVVQ